MEFNLVSRYSQYHLFGENAGTANGKLAVVILRSPEFAVPQRMAAKCTKICTY